MFGFLLMLIVSSFPQVNAESVTTVNFKPLIEGKNPGEVGSAPSFSYDGQEIVYYSNTSLHEPAIWVMTWDGTDRRMLYANKDIDTSFSRPRFSPDGKNIIFRTLIYNDQNEWEGSSIDVLVKSGYRWNSNCSIHTLTRGASYPSYTPDGTKLVTEGSDIIIMDIDGSNKTNITSFGDVCIKPSISLDGQKIVFLRYSESGNYELWIVDIDGGNVERLLEDSWHPDYPVFMSDGKILFQSARVSLYNNELDEGNIWMMDQDGSNKTLIVTGLNSEQFPSDEPGVMNFNDYTTVSPNNTRIVFEHYPGRFYYVDDPDGVWEDSDGDGIADVCDAQPNVPSDGPIFWIGIIVVLIAVPVIYFVVKKQKKSS